MLRRILSFVILIHLIPSVCFANNLVVSLTDNKNKPLSNAVVYILPLVKKAQNSTPKKITIQQRNKAFQPYVSVFQKGTIATFLNRDPVKHHVYSFSKPKKFEIKLYSGKPPKTITFNQPGMVTFGCNIHDQMLAYAFVVDTPYYALSNAQGKAVLKGVPNGQFLLKVQHPQQKNGVNIQQKISLPNKIKHYKHQLVLKPQWKKRKKNTSSVIYDEGNAR